MITAARNSKHIEKICLANTAISDSEARVRNFLNKIPKHDTSVSDKILRVLGANLSKHSIFAC